MFADEINIVLNIEVALIPSAFSLPGFTPFTSMSLYLEESSTSLLILNLPLSCDSSQCYEGGAKRTQPQASS